MTVHWIPLLKALGVCVVLALAGAGIAIGLGWLAGKHEIVLPISFGILFLIFVFWVVILTGGIEI